MSLDQSIPVELVQLSTKDRNDGSFKVSIIGDTLVGKSSIIQRALGQDFNDFTMYGGRRRCCVSNDGTINAYYGEQDYVEDGSNGQVMVYQPKFYYCMVPLKLEKQASGLGYHIRKANYYVTANPHPGFKLHPLFYDANGNEVDYVLLSAYEGSMYDVSESAYVNDGVDSISYASGDLLCSVSGKKPISGKLGGVGSKTQFETTANNIGSGWHLNTIKAESANRLLMIIELGRFKTQAAIGQGVVSQSGADNASFLTGSTANLGNGGSTVIKGLPSSATYKVQEAVNQLEGYSVTVVDSNENKGSYEWIGEKGAAAIMPRSCGGASSRRCSFHYCSPN